MLNAAKLITVYRPSILSTRKYQFRGQGLDNNASAATFDWFIDIGPAAPDRLLIVAVAAQNATGITSMIVDPNGQNLTMTQDAVVTNGTQASIFSLLVPNGSGPTALRLTLATGFLIRGMAVWAARGLSSNLVKNTVQQTTLSATLSVTAGDLVVGAHFIPSQPAPLFGASTPEIPLERIGTKDIHISQCMSAQKTATYTFKTITGSSVVGVWASYA